MTSIRRVVSVLQAKVMVMRHSQSFVCAAGCKPVVNYATQLFDVSWNGGAEPRDVVFGLGHRNDANERKES